MERLALLERLLLAMLNAEFSNYDIARFKLADARKKVLAEAVQVLFILALIGMSILGIVSIWFATSKFASSEVYKLAIATIVLLVVLVGLALIKALPNVWRHFVDSVRDYYHKKAAFEQTRYESYCHRRRLT
jgi:uncharacterized membrane protein